MRLKRRILITGGGGMLAWDLNQVFSRAGDPSLVFNCDRAALDITSESSIQSAMGKYGPEWVFNCAAYTSVDGAETERDTAENINARGPALLARACREAGAKLIHFGTDQVFDGTVETPRREDESPHPSNHYAASKLRGEQAVLKESPNLVLRVQWLYGQRKDRFSPLRQKTVFSPFADQIGAPTWTRKIAETLVMLLEKDARGLFHFSYDDHASWAEVFQFVKEEWDLPLRLEPKKTVEMKLPAARPLYSVLSNEKLKAALGISALGSWKAPLKEFLRLAAIN